MMMKFFCIFAAFALVAVAAKPEDKNLLTDLIRYLMNQNRGLLADITIEDIDLGDSGSVSSLNIQNLENIFLKQLDSESAQSMDITNATVTLDTGSATASFNFINIEVPDIELKLSGNGNLQGNLTNFWGSCMMTFTFNGRTLVLESFTDVRLQIGKIDANLEGIEDADKNNEIINTKLAEWLVNNLPKITVDNQKSIIGYINTLLEKISYY